MVTFIKHQEKIPREKIIINPSRNTKDLVNTTSNYIFVNPKGKLVINDIKSF